MKLSPSARAVLAVVLLLSGGTAIVLGARRSAERQRTSAEITRLRDELYRARVASDRCRGSLVNSELSLRTLTVTIDSLKSRVDSFEALAGGRVPAGRYVQYLETFDSYNDSVAVWEIRSRRLRAVETSCRTVIGQHNALSDSLRIVLHEAGIEAG